MLIGRGPKRTETLDNCRKLPRRRTEDLEGPRDFLSTQQCEANKSTVVSIKRIAANATTAISDASLMNLSLAALALWRLDWSCFGLAMVTLGSGLFLESWAKRVRGD